MALAWLKARQTQYTAYASVYFLVVLAVLAAVNFLANRYDKSYDSTTNKQFSLSDQTIKVVKGLKRDELLIRGGVVGLVVTIRQKIHGRKHREHHQDVNAGVCRVLSLSCFQPGEGHPRTSTAAIPSGARSETRLEK